MGEWGKVGVHKGVWRTIIRGSAAMRRHHRTSPQPLTSHTDPSPHPLVLAPHPPSYVLPLFHLPEPPMRLTPPYTPRSSSHLPHRSTCTFHPHPPHHPTHPTPTTTCQHRPPLLSPPLHPIHRTRTFTPPLPRVLPHPPSLARSPHTSPETNAPTIDCQPQNHTTTKNNFLTIFFNFYCQKMSKRCLG